MKCRYIASSLLLCALLASGSSDAIAQVVFNQNATIDYPITQQNVHIVDGATPPTRVDILSPALIEQDLIAFGTSVVELLGGSIGGGIGINNAATVNMHNGTVARGIFSNDAAVVNISGGDISGEINAQWQSIITIQGGTISAALNPEQFATIRIDGTGFNYLYGPIAASVGTLTGILRSGDPISVFFNTDAEGTIVLVPEPSGLAMSLIGCCVGAIAALRRFRRTRLH